MLTSLAAATLLSFSTAYATAHDHHLRHLNQHDALRTRNVVYDDTIADSYDFVIVGGGLAGLVVASRLSEDSNHSVLVLEAGQTGDDVKDKINHPGNTYWDSLAGTDYDWQYSTAAQSSLNNRALSWPRGKVLGGSVAINGMYLVRPSELELSAWHDLIAGDDADAAKLWAWDNFYQVMKDTETFDEPSEDVKNTAAIDYNLEHHGTSGPIHHGYPGYEFPLVANWTASCENVGIPSTADAYGGLNNGAYVANSAINSGNWTRSYSRSGYIDSLPPRDNLDILAGYTVTNIGFDTSGSDGVTANTVSFAQTSTSEWRSVKVNKEVILAGGTVGTPQVLLLSGIGPKDVIESVGVSVVHELPGVGQHLQDHVSGALFFTSTAETAGDFHASAVEATTSDEFMSYINSATAYVNSTLMFGSETVATMKSTMEGAVDSSAATVPTGDSTVLAGYKATYEATKNLFETAVAQVELLQSITAAGAVILQAAIQHPLSQGHIYLNSSSVFDSPIIDPGYMSVATDITLMREGLKLARQISQAEPMSAFLTETVPGADVDTDEEWDAWLKDNVGTEYHPCGSASMLPLNQGGVVNAKLQVYGTSNVRVIDSSVIPIQLSSHLGAPTYAIAEIGAQIIRDNYNGAASSTGSSGSGSGSNSASPSSTGAQNSTEGNGDGASALSVSSLLLLLPILAMLSFL